MKFSLYVFRPTIFRSPFSVWHITKRHKFIHIVRKFSGVLLVSSYLVLLTRICYYWISTRHRPPSIPGTHLVVQYGQKKDKILPTYRTNCFHNRKSLWGSFHCWLNQVDHIAFTFQNRGFSNSTNSILVLPSPVTRHPSPTRHQASRLTYKMRSVRTSVLLLTRSFSLATTLFCLKTLFFLLFPHSVLAVHVLVCMYTFPLAGGFCSCG